MTLKIGFGKAHIAHIFIYFLKCVANDIHSCETTQENRYDLILVDGCR